MNFLHRLEPKRDILNIQRNPYSWTVLVPCVLRPSFAVVLRSAPLPAVQSDAVTPGRLVLQPLERSVEGVAPRTLPLSS